MGVKPRRDTPLAVQIYYGSATLLFLPPLLAFVLVVSNGDTPGTRALIAKLNRSARFSAPHGETITHRGGRARTSVPRQPAWVSLVEAETQSCWSPECRHHTPDGLAGASYTRSRLTIDEANLLAVPASTFTVVVSCVRGWPWIFAGDCWRHERQPAVFEVLPTARAPTCNLYLHADFASDRMACRPLSLDPYPCSPRSLFLSDEE